MVKPEWTIILQPRDEQRTLLLYSTLEDSRLCLEYQQTARLHDKLLLA